MNRSYWYDIQSQGRMVGDTLYRLENDMGFFLNAFAVDYSQVIATDENGEKTIIIDHNSDQLQKYVLVFLAIVLTAGGIITYFTVNIVRAIKIVDAKNEKTTPTRKE